MISARSLALFCAPVAAAAAWTVFAGKDVNWDLLNYHFYVAYELLDGRLRQDFFAASAQSYLNPVGYLPFYLMVAAGWHSILISVVLAALHALSVSLLFLLAWRLFAHRAPAERAVFSGLAAALGGATAVFWPMVGSSFLDPLLAPLMLAGLLVLMSQGAGAPRRAALAGALFGIAGALKYSNAIYALAALPLAVAMAPDGARLRSGASYMAGGAVTIAVLAGPWLALLAYEFGNPVFPLLNGWFQSPLAPAINLVNERFTPRDWLGALSFPLRLASLERDVYSEILAPDLRPAAVLLAGAALPLAILAGKARTANRLAAGDWALFGFFSLGWLLWVLTSANARYGLVVLLLAGVVLARLAERLLQARAARMSLAVLLVVQVAVSVIASPPRWFLAEPWSSRWLPYDAPERARREPALYLSLEILSMAAVAPFLHPASSFVNFRGQHSVPSDSPRLAELLERHHGRVRLLARRLEPNDAKPSSDEVLMYDRALRRIGYRTDPSDCYTIAWRPDDSDWLSGLGNRLSPRSPATEPLSVVSCVLVPAVRDPVDIQREREASAVFNRIESACPVLFRGQTSVTEPFGSGWSRNYNGLDARMEAFGERVFFHRYRSAEVIDLGRLADWHKEEAIQAQACRLSGRRSS